MHRDGGFVRRDQPGHVADPAEEDLEHAQVGLHPEIAEVVVGRADVAAVAAQEDELREPAPRHRRGQIPEHQAQRVAAEGQGARERDVLDALAERGRRQRQHRDVVRQPSEGGAEHLHAEERVGDERKVRAVLLDRAHVEHGRGVAVALGDRVDLLPRVVRPVAMGRNRPMETRGELRGELLQHSVLRHTPAVIVWLGARAASAGRTSAQNRPSCSSVSARRMPGK